MNFRDLSDGLNPSILAALGDDALLDGRGVRILFAAPWIGPEIGTLRTDIVQPIAYLPEADAADAREGSILAFLGRDYDVVGLEPDGTGWIGLVLRDK